MEVFLGWSGQRSRRVAEELHDWLPHVTDAEMWISTHEIAAGAVWPEELDRALERASAAVICVTRENLASPWIFFEAGKLATGFGKRIICYLLHLPKLPDGSPLSLHQSVTADEKGTKELVRSLNAVVRETRTRPPKRRSADRTKETEFRRLWPKLKNKLNEIAQLPPGRASMPMTLFIGRGKDSIDQVLAMAKDASIVRNTFILFRTGLRSEYPESTVNRIRDHIAAFVNEGGEWDDIASQEMLNWRNESYFSSLLKAEKERKGKYQLWRLKSSYPAINLMLLRSRGWPQREEAIFGWEHYGGDDSGNVFWSSDPDVVQTLENYWSALKRDADLVQEPADRTIAPLDLEGVWFRVAEAADPKSDDPQDDYDIAVVHIEADADGRCMHFRGHRYFGSNDEKFRSVSIGLVAEHRALWFTTSRTVEATLYSAGRYIFGPANASGRFWQFWGDFVDLPVGSPARRVNVTGGRRVVIGADGEVILDDGSAESVCDVDYPEDDVSCKRLALRCLELSRFQQEST